MVQLNMIKWFWVRVSGIWNNFYKFFLSTRILLCWMHSESLGSVYWKRKFCKKCELSLQKDTGWNIRGASCWSWYLFDELQLVQLYLDIWMLVMNCRTNHSVQKFESLKCDVFTKVKLDSIQPLVPVGGVTTVRSIKFD